MNSLYNKINSIEKRIKELGLDPNRTMVIFAVGACKEWNTEKQEYLHEENVSIEDYLVPKKLSKYFDKANNLMELRKLSKKYDFDLCVMPSETSMQDLWRDKEDKQ